MDIDYCNSKGLFELFIKLFKSIRLADKHDIQVP